MLLSVQDVVHRVRSDGGNGCDGCSTAVICKGGREARVELNGGRGELCSSKGRHVSKVVEENVRLKLY